MMTGVLLILNLLKKKVFNLNFANYLGKGPIEIKENYNFEQYRERPFSPSRKHKYSTICEIARGSAEKEQPSGNAREAAISFSSLLKSRTQTPKNENVPKLIIDLDSGKKKPVKTTLEEKNMNIPEPTDISVTLFEY